MRLKHGSPFLWNLEIIKRSRLLMGPPRIEKGGEPCNGIPASLFILKNSVQENSIFPKSSQISFWLFIYILFPYNVYFLHVYSGFDCTLTILMIYSYQCFPTLIMLMLILINVFFILLRFKYKFELASEWISEYFYCLQVQQYEIKENV